MDGMKLFNTIVDFEDLRRKIISLDHLYCHDSFLILSFVSAFAGRTLSRSSDQPGSQRMSALTFYRMRCSRASGQFELKTVSFAGGRGQWAWSYGMSDVQLLFKFLR